MSFVAGTNQLKLLRETDRRKAGDYTRNPINSRVVSARDGASLPAAARYPELMERFDTASPMMRRGEDHSPHKFSPLSFSPGVNQGLSMVYVTMAEKSRFAPISNMTRWEK